jgi:hypothetical protein
MMVAPEDQQPAAKLKTLKDIEKYAYWAKTEDRKTRQV